MASKQPDKNASFSYNIMVYSLSLILCFLVFIPILVQIKWLSGSLFHTFMEIVATIIAFIVGLVALRFYKVDEEEAYLLIGTGFIGASFLDSYHAIVTSSWFAPLLPSGLDSLIPWSWFASRFFISLYIMLSFIAFYLYIKNNLKIFDKTIVYLLSIVLTIFSLLFFAFVPLPSAYYPDIIIHRPEEFIPGILFLISMAGYLLAGHWKSNNNSIDINIIYFLAISLVTQAYMSVSYQIFDTMFDLAHMLKITSYLIMLFGLLNTMKEKFRREVLSRKQLDEYANKLSKSYISLKSLKKTIEMENEIFEKYVPKEFLNSLASGSILNIRLGSATKEHMVIMFTDIRKFTTISEKLLAEQTFRFVNTFLSYMVPVIKSHEGLIDKFLGDGIMSVFRSADDAVKCSIEFKEAIKRINADPAIEALKVKVAIGSGMHFGEIMMGVIGTENRMNTTVLSDSVNLASRIEGLCSYFKSQVLFSEEFLDAITDKTILNYRFLGSIMVKGKTTPIKLYELIDAEPDEIIGIKLQLSKKFAESLTLFYQGAYKDAHSGFSQCLEIYSDDTASRYYLDRSMEFLQGKLPETIFRFD